MKTEDKLRLIRNKKEQETLLLTEIIDQRLSPRVEQIERAIEKIVTAINSQEYNPIFKPEVKIPDSVKVNNLAEIQYPTYPEEINVNSNAQKPVYVQLVHRGEVYKAQGTSSTIYATGGSNYDQLIYNKIVNGTVSTTETIPSTIITGQKTTTTSSPASIGTATCQSVMIQAKADNTGLVYVGNSSNQYVELNASESVTLDIDNISKVYIKVANNNEGINYLGVA